MQDRSRFQGVMGRGRWESDYLDRTPWLPEWIWSYELALVVSWLLGQDITALTKHVGRLSFKYRVVFNSVCERHARLRRRATKSQSPCSLIRPLCSDENQRHHSRFPPQPNPSHPTQPPSPPPP